VTYDADLDVVKRIVQDVGRALLEDPAFSSQILETLKMHGIEQFGDFGVRVDLKMKTRPGDQHLIRWRAHELLKRAFTEQSIKFAYPTVAVIGDISTGAAAGAGNVGVNLARQTVSNQRGT
jgi:small-conductance mechanosensitive channel